MVREEMIAGLQIVCAPKGRGYSSEEINQLLLTLCAASPDPIGAMRLVVESLRPMTVEELVDEILALNPRKLSDVPGAELPISHPLRRMCR
jgi:hypothetical protein